MPAEVVGLHDRLLRPEGEPYPRIIEKLEGWLAAAKRGEVDGIAIAVSRPNNRVGTDFYLGPDLAVYRVVAAVNLLTHDINAEMLDRAPEQDLPGA